MPPKTWRPTCLQRVSMEARMSDRMRRIHRIHFVGIGGSRHERHRRSAVNLGYEVQG